MLGHSKMFIGHYQKPKNKPKSGRGMINFGPIYGASTTVLNKCKVKSHLHALVNMRNIVHRFKWFAVEMYAISPLDWLQNWQSQYLFNTVKVRSKTTKRPNRKVAQNNQHLTYPLNLKSEKSYSESQRQSSLLQKNNNHLDFKPLHPKKIYNKRYQMRRYFSFSAD